MPGYFPSFNPRSDQVVAGNGGKLVVTDIVSGAEVERLPMPAAKVGGEPDWAWGEDKIVAAYGNTGLENFMPDVGINMGAIAQWVKGAEGWSEPEVLVEREGEVSNDRPAYSPDGRFIAFEQRGAGQVQQGEGQNFPDTMLWIIPAAGGVPPVALTRANFAQLVGNSWPKWAPISGPGRLWLAFSSVRNYGNKLIQGEDTRPQLWITGIDINAAPGEDPSSPAFWLPGQALDSGNHIPYWAVYQKR